MPDTWYIKFAHGVVGPVSRTELDYLLTRDGHDPATEISQSPGGPWSVPVNPASPAKTSTAPEVIVSPTKVALAPQRQTVSATRKPTAAAVKQSGPPPLPSSRVRRRTKQFAAIGAAAALLLVVLLLLWRERTPHGHGQVAGAAHGNGAGRQGTGSGTGEGSTESPAVNPSPQAPATATPTESLAASPVVGPTASPETAQPPEEKRITFVPLGGAGTATFFGATAAGTRFAYVVDRSGSMAGEPFEQATRQLAASIANLNSECDFYVVLFNEAPLVMFAPDEAQQFVPATKESKARLSEWVRTVDAAGGTSPLGATLQALALKPDALFLLTDGQFTPSDADAIIAAATEVSAVHTIAIGSGAEADQLRRIADKTGGTYRFVP